MSTTTIDLPGAPDIAGLAARRPMVEQAAEYEAIASLINAANAADDIQWRITPALVREDLVESGRCVPAEDVALVGSDRELVAMAGLDRVVSDGQRVYEIYGYVHPRWRRRGIGRTLLRWSLDHARSLANGDPADMEVHVRREVEEGQPVLTALLVEHGFAEIRWSFLMRHAELDHVPDVPMPAGLDLRPVTSEQHRAIFDAQTEAFRDHWGFREPTEEEFRAIYAREELDTDLWVVAWDGDEIAGVIENWIWPDENAQMGIARAWQERVSVRRPWRRRGLARAMLAESLHRVHAAGMTESMLGVDVENPNGALGLYEGVGFTVHRREAVYDLRIER